MRRALPIILLALILGTSPLPSVPAQAASAGLRCGTSDDPTPTVPASTPTASATATDEPLPTWTPHPSQTPYTPTSTATVTSSPSPEPTRCTRQPVEVTLIIDASTSMWFATDAGRTKIDAALDAAGQFVGMLEFEHGDGVGLVAFNDNVWVWPVTYDEGVVRYRLGRIPDKRQEGTRIDLALQAAGDVVRTGSPTARRVAILLTDGYPNRVPYGPGTRHPACLNQECTVVNEARVLRATGAEVIAIGLGDVLDRLMILIPDDPSLYYYAPDGEDLAAIYRQIAAGLVSCDGGGLSQESRGLLQELGGLSQESDGLLQESAPVLSPAWTVETVTLSQAAPGERILVGGDRAPNADELRSIALYNRGHIVADPILERAGYGIVWTPGRENERLDWRGQIDLQGSGVSAWREEVGTLIGPQGDTTGATLSHASPSLDGSRHEAGFRAGGMAPVNPTAASSAGSDSMQPAGSDPSDRHGSLANRADSIAQGDYWPSDSHFANQWALRGLHGLQWAAAWLGLNNLGDGGESSIIAIIDNGLECAHPDLNCHVGTHYNATRDDELRHRSPWDTEVLVQGAGYDHGTFVAGIASAHVDNGYGIAGISRAAVVDAQGCIGGGCAESDVIRAMQWIGEQADNGLPIRAVNMSFAFKTSRLCGPIAELRSRGIMPFAAVGNSGDRTTGDRPQYPAACADAVGLAHSQEDGTLDPQAQRAAVSLSAPGSEVRSLCARPHTTGVGSGSSFASPAGASAYALVRSALEPAVGAARAAEQALDILYQTADPIEPASHPRGSADPGRDGYGRINLERALAMVADEWVVLDIPTPGATPTSPHTPTATPCADTPARCAAIGTATAISRGTPTPTPPPASPTIDPTVAAILTGTPIPSETPRPTIDPTVAALLTAAVTPSATPTIDPTEVARILTEMAPSPTSDKMATAHWLRCFVIDRCAPVLYLPSLTK